MKGHNADTPHKVDKTLGAHEQRHVESFKAIVNTEYFMKLMNEAEALFELKATGDATGKKLEAQLIRMMKTQLAHMNDYFEAWMDYHQRHDIDGHVVPKPTFQGKSRKWGD